MAKRSRENSIKLLDLPRDILKHIILYSPKEFLQLSKSLCRICRSLRRKIDVSKAKKYSIDHKSIYNTIFSSYNITTLNVNGWTKWNDNCVEYISKLIKQGYFKSLKSIYMRNCQNVTNKSLHILLPTIGKNLIDLDLYNCKNSLYLGFNKTTDAPESSTTDVLEYIFNNYKNDKLTILFPNLEYLQLYNYTGIKSLTPLLNISSTLKFLDIRGCIGIDPNDFKLISNFKNLQQLHIGMNVDNESLLEIIKSCTNLIALDISESLISLDVVKSIAYNLPKLSLLKLTKCSTLNNEGIIKLLSNLCQLSIIDVSHCWRLTNSFLDNLSHIASGNLLSKIGIYMCSLDSSKLIYKFNTCGSNNVVPVIHNELQIDINLYQ